MWGIKTMTNREWLIKEMQNMSDEELVKTVLMCKFITKKECREKTTGCIDCGSNWLNAEHKEVIKLSDVEKVILENLPEEYKYISRDEDNTLKIGTEKLKKADRGYWYCERCQYTVLEPFEHLFQFIKWKDTEPYNIKELLKGE